MTRFVVCCSCVAAGVAIVAARLAADSGPALGPVRPTGSIPAADRSALRGWVAYSTRAGDIWVMNANGTGRRRITRSDPGNDFDPSFSPRARYVVFRTSRGHYVPDPHGSGAEGIFVVDVRSKRHRETQPRTGGLFPAWAPDGSLIAFSGLRLRKPGDSIFVMTPRGTRIRDLGNIGAAETATWSPDSRRIAYSRHRGDGNRALWIMNRDGTHKRQLTRPVLVEPAGSGGDYPGAWSPDGTQIVYSSGQFRSRDLYVINVQTAAVRRLTDWPGSDAAVAWLRSGQIVFGHFRGYEPLPKWYMVNPDGTNLRSLPWFYGAGDPLDWVQPAARPRSTSALGPVAVPRPTGPLPFGTETLTLVDRSRRDPFAAEREPRRILAQVYYPAVGGGGRRARYMPTAVAKALASLGVPATILRSVATNARLNARARRGRFPVLVFSPGYSVPHSLYTGLFEELASRGYVVIAVDHTRETEVVEFPNGETVRRTLPPDPRNLILRAIGARIDDVAFVFDNLDSLSRRGALAGADVSRVGVLGHSLGGLTAASIAAAKPSIACAADMAGSVYGRARRRPFRRPFLILDGSQRESTLARWWTNLKGRRYWVTLTAATHLNFTDWSWLAPALKARGLTPPVENLGSIDGTRALALERRYVGSFFDECLKRRASRVFDSPTPEPDVRIRR